MKSFTFDPDGDVRLVLTIEDQRASNKRARLKDNLPQLEHASLDKITSPQIKTPLPGSYHENVSPAKDKQVTKRKRDTVEKSEESKGAPTQPASETEMLVSSKHLMLASKVFKAMLSPRFSEGITLQSYGKVDIHLFDDDEEALKIVLDIIHGHLKKVPKSIDLATMTQVALLADKYDLLEMVEHFSDLWIEKLQKQLPLLLDETLLPWLCTAWLFKNNHAFSHVTRIAQKFSTGKLTATNLPIPEKCSIEISRVRGIEKAILLLGNSIRRFENPETLCRGLRHTNLDQARTCSATTLGALIRSAIARGIYHPPASPYAGYSYYKWVDNIRAMYFKSLCEEIDKDSRVSKTPATKKPITTRHCHSLQMDLERGIKKIDDLMQGLELKDFQ